MLFGEPVVKRIEINQARRGRVAKVKHIDIFANAIHHEQAAGRRVVSQNLSRTRVAATVNPRAPTTRAQ